MKNQIKFYKTNIMKQDYSLSNGISFPLNGSNCLRMRVLLIICLVLFSIIKIEASNNYIITNNCLEYKESDNNSAKYSSDSVYLSVSDSSINFSSIGGSDTIIITSGVDWKVTFDQQWLSLIVISDEPNLPPSWDDESALTSVWGSGNGIIVISAEHNAGMKRTAKVAISSESIDSTVIEIEQAACSSLDRGLVAYYPFNSNANDESGNGNNGVVYGTTLATDRFGNVNSAYSFDGSSSYINIPFSSSFMLKQNVTTCAWIKLSTIPNGEKMIFINLIDPDNWGIFLSLAANKLSTAITTSNRTYQCVSDDSISTEKWYFITGVRNGTSLKLYVNGVFNEEITIPSTDLRTGLNSDSRIGKAQNNYISSVFQGEIDEIRLYDRALSDTEIDSIYHEGGWPLEQEVDLTKGLVAYYPFNGNANDESGNGNDGMVGNGTFTQNRFGINRSAYFSDGIDDRIVINNSELLNFKNDFSVSFWIKTQGLNSEAQSFFVHKADWQTQTGWGFMDNGQYYSRVLFRILPGSSEDQMSISRELINDNKWHNIIGVRNGNENFFYLDDSLVCSYSANFNFCYDSLLIIGDFNGNNGGGSIDDVFIYNRSISQNEVDSIYHLGEWVNNKDIDLTNGLIAYFPFNGNANDESGNGNNGVVNGATLTFDRNGNNSAAYSFDGVNDFIEVPHSEILNISDSISISIWLQYNEGVASTYEDIIMKGNNTYGFQFSSSGGQIMFHILSGGWRNLNSGVTPENNKWYHIVGTFDGNTQKIYVNGILKATSVWSGMIATSSDPVYFGFMVASDNDWYNGVLDDFRLYNRALNESEITALWLETANDTTQNLIAEFSSTSYLDRVKFTNQSTGKATTYSWDFGDGNSSQEENPLHIYASGGTYTVSFIASNSTSSDTIAKNITIEDESIWAMSGIYTVDQGKSEIRNFTEITEVFELLSRSSISGDATFQAQSGQTFEIPLSSEVFEDIDTLKTKIVLSGRNVRFVKNGGLNNPVFNFTGTINQSYFEKIISLSKYLSFEDVDIAINGNPINLSALLNFQSVKTCTGSLTNSINFTEINSSYTYNWGIISVPLHITGFTGSGSTMIPPMTLVNHSTVDDTLKYYVNMYDNGVLLLDTLFSIIVNPGIQGAFTSLYPADNIELSSTNIEFSWNLIENATYDLYFWEATNSVQTTPTVSNLSTIRYASSTLGEYGKSYNWKVVANGECNSIESGIDSFRIRFLPDLHVTDINSSEAYAGQEFTVSWDIKNDGVGTTMNTTWTDYIWLVPDIYTGTSNNSTLLKEVQNVSALLPGQSYSNSVVITLPERLSGDFYLVVTSDMYGIQQVDWSTVGNSVPDPYLPNISGIPYFYLKGVTNSWNNKVEEDGETLNISDNFNYKKINILIPPLPDLQITSIITPDNSYSGNMVSVQAEVTNNGEANTSGNYWVDALYRGHSPHYYPDSAVYVGSLAHQAVLNQGESYSIDFNAHIPIEYYGQTYFYVLTDFYDHVYEHANNANNISVSNPVNIILTPPADLTPISIEIPSFISTSSAFNIAVETENVGAGNTNKTGWVDKLYLSKKETGIDGSAIEIFSIAYNNMVTIGDAVSTIPGSFPAGSLKTLMPLSPQHSYTVDGIISLGNIDAGTYYVYAYTDVYNHVFELDQEANNILLLDNMVTVIKPDLVVQDVNAPDTLYSGRIQSIDWTVLNNGDGEIKDKNVTDFIYLSKNANGQNSIEIARVSQDQWLIKDSKKILRTNVTLPNRQDLDGTCYLFVATDQYNAIYETNETNNISIAHEVIYKYNPKSDLTVSDLSLASSIEPGELLIVNYKVNNIGALNLNTENYSIGIYLTDPNNLNGQAVKCEIEQQIQPASGSGKIIAAGGFTQFVQQIRIPANAIGGNRSIFVVIDREGVLDEANASNNSASGSLFVAGNLPDLTITGTTVPLVIHSGINTGIEWNVTNIGDISCSDWVDAVYLSSDNILSSDDEQLIQKGSSSLEAGSFYTRNITINIPDRLYGSHYLFIVADKYGQLTDFDRSNNQISVPVSVVLSPLPDLHVKEVEVHSELVAGQPVKVNYQVENIGENATRQNKWSDEFYLSAGTTLNKNEAIFLGSKLRIGNLNTGGFYTDSIEVNIPVNFSGNYNLFLSTDAGNTIYEGSDENNNVGNTSVFIYQPLPCDLVVEQVTAPDKIKVGNNFVITWNVKNIGSNPATGILKDAIYVSKDAVWDLSDIQVGSLSENISVQPGNTQIRTVSGAIYNVPAGEYYLIIRTNQINNIIESSLTNNYASTIIKSEVDFNEHTIGNTDDVEKTKYFKIVVDNSNAGQTLSLKLETDDENIKSGLWVSHNSVPSLSEYDFSSSKLKTTEQQILIPSLETGIYYILAKENSTSTDNIEIIKWISSLPSPSIPSLSANNIITLSSKILHFEISDVSTNRGGNSGSVTSDITGAKFDTIMDFRLKNTTQLIPAEAVYFQDQTESMVSFNLKNYPVGLYNVEAELPGGLKTTFSGGYSIVSSVPSQLYTRLIAPSSVRVNTKMPFSVEYSNSGSTDINVSELLLVSENGHSIGLNTQELDSAYTEIRIPLHEDDGLAKPQVLPPGSKGTKTFFIYADKTSTISLKLYIIRKEY